MNNMNAVTKDEAKINPAAEAWSAPEVVKGDQEAMREQIQNGMANEAIKTAGKRSVMDGPTDAPRAAAKEMPQQRYASPIDGAPVTREEYMDIINSDWK